VSQSWCDGNLVFVFSFAAGHAEMASQGVAEISLLTIRAELEASVEKSLGSSCGTDGALESPVEDCL
jgi:hypothetical protein